MTVSLTHSVEEALSGNSYPGRGIITGKTSDGRNAVIAYFIMGRSENSRNRVFVEEDDRLLTAPFDEAKLEDPSLIIYNAVRTTANHLIVSNGDHTDTIAEGLKKGLSFSESLSERTFEPDAPNFTPRISSLITFKENDFSYQMSILKSMDASGMHAARFFYEYDSIPGYGHFIHTYQSDGSPLPPFCGEPDILSVPDDIDTFSENLWKALDADNRISLYVRYTDLRTRSFESCLINKNVDGEQIK